MAKNMKMTPSRKKSLIRDSKGRIKKWKGGKSKKDLKKKKNNFQGISIHIGNEFKKQNGRTAKIGDSVRTKNKSGSFHKSAEFYVKTKNGWRSTGNQKKPTKAEIKKLNENSRKGR